MGMSEAGSEGVFEFIEEPDANVVVPRVAGLREALLSLDRWHFPDPVKKRACVMRSVPRFLKGPYRNALRVALEEATAEQVCRQERGWKLFIPLPRMLLHRPPRGGLSSKEKLIQRFDAFSHGQWESLLEASARCDEQAECLGGGADDEMETTSNAEQREPRCWLVWVNCLLPDKPWRAHRWPLARRRPGSCSQIAGSVHQSCWTPSLLTSPVTCHQHHLHRMTVGSTRT